MIELIDKAKDGNEEAFTELMLSIKDDLYKIAKIRIYNDDDINDAIQETMIKVYKSLNKLKDNEKFKFWVIKILINNCNSIYRKKSKKEKIVEEYELDKFVELNSYKSIEDNLYLYSLLDNLKYNERTIVMLYYMEEFSIKEIKKILKMNENTIKTHLYRARQIMKKIIEEDNSKYA